MSELTYKTHAMRYLQRLRTIQNKTLALLQSLSDKCDKFANMEVEYSLEEDPQWKALEDKLNHIYRTYQRM